MKNNLPNPESNSGGKPLAPNTTAATRELGPVFISAMQRLALPPPGEFAAAYARGLDAPPVRLPNLDYPVIPLFDPNAGGDSVTEDASRLSPKQKERIVAVLRGVATTPPKDEEELVRRTCAAMGRIPLGYICVTVNAAASELPADIIYRALLVHRQLPDDHAASHPRATGQQFIDVTWHREAESAWPEFAIATIPTAAVTVIALRDEMQRSN